MGITSLNYRFLLQKERVYLSWYPSPIWDATCMTSLVNWMESAINPQKSKRHNFFLQKKIIRIPKSQKIDFSLMNKSINFSYDHLQRTLIWNTHPQYTLSKIIVFFFCVLVNCRFEDPDDWWVVARVWAMDIIRHNQHLRQILPHPFYQVSGH